MKKFVQNLNKPLKGEITIPSDKSISHRAVIFSSLAKGKSVIKNLSKGQDPLSSLKICQNLGVQAEFVNDDLIINSSGRLIAPTADLDCGNSGTTMRFMSGILAGQNFNSALIGDESLSKRPMKRVIEPLTLMGAKIEGKDYKAPLKNYGQNLHAIEYNSPLSSAQVKSCALSSLAQLAKKQSLALSSANKKKPFSGLLFISGRRGSSWICSTLTEFRFRHFVPVNSICSLSGFHFVSSVVKEQPKCEFVADQVRIFPHLIF